MDWAGRKVLVTSGPSFIGLQLVDVLLQRDTLVRVIDDLSSGKVENSQPHLDAGRIELIQTDLKDPGVAMQAVSGMEIVFHLAADHGGRGYLDLHQAACATNLLLDGLVFRACHSGCVYPNYLQTDPGKILYLTEDMVGPPMMRTICTAGPSSWAK